MLLSQLIYPFTRGWYPQIVHCSPETKEEAAYVIDLVYAEKAIFRATKHLADARALESQLHAEFYELQSNKANSLMKKADLDIGVTTLSTMWWGLYQFPTPVGILQSQKYHSHRRSLLYCQVKDKHTELTWQVAAEMELSLGNLLLLGWTDIYMTT